MKHLFLLFCLILCSCSREYSYVNDEPPPPPPPDDDLIEVSSMELQFSYEGGIDSITTEKENWQIQPSIELGEISYLSNGEVIKIEGIWLTAYKTDKKKVLFSVNRNETGKERSYIIFLKSNNYNTKDIFYTSPANNNIYTSIYINQSAE